MKNYIIINGEKSTNYTGLLIQSLPPITKPLLRTQIEEIDGKDGDEIIPLGYSAYDKTFSIGLSYDYKIDDIIKYLNQDGKITFSNEPDKFYNFNSINQIDFERLIRFKTANITLHVQPFKYSNIESTKTYTFTEESQSLIVRNNGNIYSKPKITIFGSGTINLSLNNDQVFIIELNEEKITIDTNTMNAYNPDTNVFLNRYVVGDYNNFILQPGANTISWTGDITQIDLDNCSRWI